MTALIQPAGAHAAPHDVRPNAAARHASANSSVSFGRLIAVEARKLVDTRAARWLLIATVLLAGSVVALTLRFSGDAEMEPMTLGAIIGLAAYSAQLLLPVVAIIAAAGEWTHHVATITYTVEPRRLRVLAAKAVAVVIASVLAFLLISGLGLAAAAIASATGITVVWTLALSEFVWVGVMTVFYSLCGLALGTLIMNTPAAIVAYFVVPTLLQVGAGMSERFADVVQWVDVSNAFGPLINNHLSEFSPGHMATTAAFWILIPLALGAIRVTRREVS